MTGTFPANPTVVTFPRPLVLAVLCAAALVAWAPRSIVPTRTPVATMLVHITADDDVPPRIDHYRLTTAQATLDVTAHASGADYRLDTVIAGDAYALGRSNGRSWRRTATGAVRVVRSDTQGDVLDRWPRSVFGFSKAHCTAAGETPDDPPQWILACHAPGDIAHDYAIDPASGRIVAEYTREGDREVDYAFDDFRDDGNGGERPYHWRISGAGGDAEVTLLDSRPATLPRRMLAIPANQTHQFTLPGDAPVALPVEFPSAAVPYLRAPVTIGGKRFTFVIDTGTAGILMDVRAAARAGLRSTLGHTVAHGVRIGPVAAPSLAIQTVDLFGGRLAGLLGSEFFTGHIVHLDYAHARLEWLPRATFQPPADASELPMNAAEGLPFVPLRIDGERGTRFLLDSAGAPNVVTSDFVQSHAIALDGLEPAEPIRYLEGAIGTNRATVDSLAIGPYTVSDAGVFVDDGNPANIDPQLDGIFGSVAMANFEWWFDYDGNRAWIRR